MTIPLHTTPLPLRRDRGERPYEPAAPEPQTQLQTQTQSQPQTQTQTRPAAPMTQRSVERTPEQDAEQAATLAMVGACLAGDGRAWQQLVTTQHRRVYGICFRFIGDASEAEDVTQDVFLKVYRNLGSFDAAKGSFQTWMTTLTRNLLVDNYRRNRMERMSDSLDAPAGGFAAGDDDGPSMAERLPDTRRNQVEHVTGLELKARIQAALGKVSPELREAVILRDLEDMDYKEIALVLKIPEGTVKSRISRGRSELARLLGRTEGRVS